MKIVTWNCNMAYRNKAEFILKYQPDIVVVPECEHPDKLKFGSQTVSPTDIIWEGINHNKGLGVFSYSNYRFKRHKIHNSAFRTILPLKVSGGKIDFTLFAIWANNPGDKRYQYIGQIWKAIRFYKRLLSDKNTMLIGDFNSNTIWDKPRREHNHSSVVEILKNKRIYSAYHKFFNQIQGQEEHKTLYMYRHNDKSYHIDYCFVSTDLAEIISEVKIGGYEEWKKLSDHTPLIVNFDL